MLDKLIRIWGYWISTLLKALQLKWRSAHYMLTANPFDTLYFICLMALLMKMFKALRVCLHVKRGYEKEKSGGEWRCVCFMSCNKWPCFPSKEGWGLVSPGLSLWLGLCEQHSLKGQKTLKKKKHFKAKKKKKESSCYLNQKSYVFGAVCSSGCLYV